MRRKRVTVTAGALAVVASLFLANASLAGPQPPKVVSIEAIAREGLMPTSAAPDRGGLVVHVPYLKLYVKGELVFAGMPSAFDRLPGASSNAAPAIDAAIKVRRLSNEARLLKLTEAGTTGPVLIAYVYDRCPPCDNLIDSALRQLLNRGYGSVEQIRVVAQ